MKELKLTLKTIYKAPTYTISKFYIDGVLFCDTIEDVVRDLNNDGDLNDEGETKVWGETAIPAGTYKVSLTMSNRFKKVLPLLHNVPNFEGIRIHGGNTAEDTHGCILVGVNDKKGRVSNSQATMSKLMPLLEKFESITIEIIR